MKRRTFLSIIALITLSLLGLSAVQFLWIEHATKLSEEQFRRDVGDALASVAQKLEMSETAHLLVSAKNSTDSAEQALLLDTQKGLNNSNIRPVQPRKNKQIPQKRRHHSSPNIDTTDENLFVYSDDTPNDRTSEKNSASQQRVIVNTPQSRRLKLPNDMEVMPINFTNSPHVRLMINGTEQDISFGAEVSSDADIFSPFFVFPPVLDATPRRTQSRSQSSRSQIQQVSSTVSPSLQPFCPECTRPAQFTKKFKALGDSLRRIESIVSVSTASYSTSPVDVRIDSILRTKLSRSMRAQIKNSTPDFVMVNVSSRKNSMVISSSALTIHMPESKTKTTISTKSTFKNRPVQAQENTEELQSACSEESVQEAKTKVYHKIGLMQTIAEKLARPQVPIQNRISSDDIDSLLRAELHSRGIDIDFDFAVRQGTQAQPALYHASTAPFDLPTILSSKFRVALFPGDVFGDPIHLFVRFPQQKIHTGKNFGLLFGTSGAFIAMLVFASGYTLWTVAHQKKLSEMKTDFINNMTHELKTPISTISLASEALAEPLVLANSSRVSRFVGVIQEENKRLGNLVERVLQAAMLERGNIALKCQHVDLHHVIDEAVQKISLQVEKKGGYIACELLAEHPILQGDEMHLTNIISNLLDNANKYTPECPIIRITTKNVHSGIMIAVSDNGIGMTREQQKRIFEQFYRVPTGNRHDVKGFGLGLSYVKTILTKMGGIITVRSDIGKGSTFEIFLPTSATV